MKIKMHTSNCATTPGMKTAAEKSLKKSSQWINEAATIEVTCRIEKEKHIVDITMLGTKTKLSASASSGDYYQSLRMAAERFEKQVIKQRKRHIDLKRLSKPLTKQSEISEREEAESSLEDEESALMFLKQGIDVEPNEAEISA